jgi:hypothetical protein
MRISDVSRYSSRLIILSSLLTVPFLRMLVQEDYGFIYVEVAAALLLIVSVAGILAAVARVPLAFHVLVVGLTVLLSANAVQFDFLPSVRLRWAIIAIVLLVAIAMLVLKEHFYRIFLVFVLGSFIGDIGKAVVERWRMPKITKVSAGRNFPHVIHLILDEMIGLAAMPPECGECIEAGATLRQVLERGYFQIYPYAFSNYRSTRDSIPSILNGRILKRNGEFLRDDELRPFLRQNRYFDAYLRKKYAVRVYQSDYIVFSSPEYPSVRGRTYRINSLKALHSVGLRWPARMRQLFVIYLQSDHFWRGVWERALPPRLHPERLRVGPLALQDIWPDQVLHDYRSATQSTLFFIHLLTPHFPYVYRSDGSSRDHNDWNSHQYLEFTDDQTDEYRRRYRLYGEQAKFAASQVGAFLEELKATGLYDSTTVIIHGDHGSRLRLLKSSERQQRRKLRYSPGPCPPDDRYDYVGEPDHRDVLNRFATLLAIKPQGADSPRVVTEPGSVLYFLQREFKFGVKPEPSEDLNSVYLFNADGSPRAIKTMSAAVASAGAFQ